MPTDDKITIIHLPRDPLVLHDQLPDWVSTDTRSKPTDESAGQSGVQDWRPEGITDFGTPDSPSPPESGSEKAQATTFQVTALRVICRECAEVTVRLHHAECEAPIIQLKDTWQCGDCGTAITPPSTCEKCGGAVDHEPVAIPLDLGPDVWPAKTERAIHRETNARRTNHGLDPLEYSDPLSAIALQHSRDMCHREYVDHISPEGDGPADRYDTYGHQTKKSGENLALVNLDYTASPAEVARKITDGWMNSEGHRENILRSSFTREGIGVYVSQTGSVYATQNFE